jgi:Cu-Zn family superoxide dismutase
VITVPIFRLRAKANPLGRQVGVIYVDDAMQHGLGRGVVFRVLMKGSGLSEGDHGFHLHEFPDLRPSRKKGKTVTGGSAGSHYDPQNTGSHRGPYRRGHLGDLPRIYADRHGNVDDLVVAPRLRLADCFGRSLIVHRGGDNYTDNPPNGGGEARVIGGVIP